MGRGTGSRRFVFSHFLSCSFLIFKGTGTHPELLHLHRELSNRRDKRLELATRKRSYEIAHVAKRRRTDEDATWSWWKVRPHI